MAQEVDNGEIDILELISKLWSKKVFILKILGIFFLIGILVSLTSTTQFKASCKLMLESQEGMKNNLNGLSGLAGLAGIDLDVGGQGSLKPEIYPEIVNSVPFQLELIHFPIFFEKLDTTISSYNYLSKYQSPSLIGWLMEYTIGLPGKFKDLVLDDEVVVKVEHDGIAQMHKKDWLLLNKFRNRLNVLVNTKTNIISISSEMPDAYAAAGLTDLIVKKLTSRITNYKIEKVKANLEFIQESYLEAEKEYEAKQKQVARFTDKNKNITSSLVQTEYQRLQNEMNIAFEVYKGLRNQLEQAKIKVKEETPIFTILEPVQVPVFKSEPRRLLIVAISIFIGLIIAIGWILSQPLLMRIKQR